MRTRGGWNLRVFFFYKRSRKSGWSQSRANEGKPRKRPQSNSMYRRSVILAALAIGASAFAPASSVLPSLRRSSAQGHAISMKSSSEEEMAADSLAQRRMVVGGLFALLAPLAGLPEGAEAAKSGGRMGGGSFRSKGAAPRGGGGRAAPRAPTAPTVISRPSVTVIQSAPSMPYGYGGGMFGGGFGGGYGFGLTPGQFLGLSAIELAESIARENRRQAYLKQQLEVQQQLGKDQAQIDALSKQLAEVSPLCLSVRYPRKQRP